MAASSLSLDDPAGGAAGPSAIAASTPARADAPVGPPPAAAADARAVTQQITQAIVRMEGARTEVTLDPVELGRISLTFVTKDDGVTVMVAADRPETADLLRRNGEQLQRDLSNAGYDGVELDFEQSGGGRDDTHQAEARNDAKASPNSPTQYRTIQIDTGLDIRI